MKRFLLLLMLILLNLNCAKEVKESSGEKQIYGNTTENTKLSADRIDRAQTFEISFTLDKPADCITIDMESVYLHKTFPIQKVPKKTFFIIEKKLNFPAFNLKGNQNYTPIGRNFNNDWELYSPIKICSSKNDPLSQLDLSEYRIRFTSFEKTGLYYIITITSETKIIFNEDLPSFKK